MLKKVLCFAVLGAVAISVVGCTPNSKQGGGNALAAIRYMLPTDPGADITSDTWSVKEWSKRTNTNIQIYPVPRESFPEKISVELASGNLPDMINFWQDKVTFHDYGPKLFVALDDYKNLTPNYLKWTEKYPEIITEIRNYDDKKTYAFPIIQDFSIFYGGWLLNKDTLKKGGMTVSDIKTVEDVKKAFNIIKNVSGKEYITGVRNGFDGLCEYTQQYFGINYFGVNNGMVLDNRSPNGTNKIVFAPTLPEYKEWVSFVKWMYDNKILHPDFATMQTQEYNAKFAEGSFLIHLESLTQAGALAYKDNPDKPLVEYIDSIKPFALADGQIRKIPMMQRTAGARGHLVISKNSKVKEQAIKAADWIYGDEGNTIMTRGIEGEHWVKDSTYPVGYRITDKGYQVGYSEKVYGKEVSSKLPRQQQDLGIMSWWLSGVIPASNRFGTEGRMPGEEKLTEFVPNLYKEFIDNGYTLPADPVIVIPRVDRGLIAEIQTPVKTYLTENVMKFIIGKRPMSEWDAFLAELKAMNYDKLVDAYNKYYIK